MSNLSTIQTDILIAGSGFAGSLMALGLRQSGFDVCLVERDSHPRFAVGESSTPIADMILRKLSSQYDLPWLHDFSRYGSWQECHPEIVCGLKRGFSYCWHKPGREFETDADHNSELLVAASSSDANSDTNWLRADFDAFLVQKVKEYGIPYYDQTDITGGGRHGGRWKLEAEREGQAFTFRSSFLLDATGSAALLKNLVHIESSPENFLTDSRALYSHFNGVGRWSDALEDSGISQSDYPYDPDHSALHHLTEDSWIWMLRFNDDRTSMGIMIDRKRENSKNGLPPEQEWESRISRFPSIKKLMADASPATEPGRIIRTGRLQRKLSRCHGPGWAALPHTVGFVDPLHSTGIAHTLSGVEKLLDLFTDGWEDREQLNRGLATYEQSVFAELKLVDVLVAGCYRTLDRFELFTIWSMLYFTAAIHYEQQRLKGNTSSHFLCAGEPAITEIVESTFIELNMILSGKDSSEKEIERFRQRVRERIEPYNIASLLDPTANNMYRHTAVDL